MKKIVGNLFLFVVLLLSLASCAAFRSSTATVAQVETNVKQFPTIVDLDIQQQRITKTVSWNWLSLEKYNLSMRKKNLMADVIEESNADILVSPQFKYVKVPFGRRTLTVTGYPATFKSFRKATEKDLDLLGLSIKHCVLLEDICTSNVEVYKKANIFQRIVGKK